MYYSSSFSKFTAAFMPIPWFGDNYLTYTVPRLCKAVFPFVFSIYCNLNPYWKSALKTRCKLSRSRVLIPPNLLRFTSTPKLYTPSLLQKQSKFLKIPAKRRTVKRSSVHCRHLPSLNVETRCVLFLILMLLPICSGLKSTAARPLSKGFEKDHSKGLALSGHKKGPPRVLMPPYDLGFRGQTTSNSQGSNNIEFNEPIHNYQSDASASSQWVISPKENPKEYSREHSFVASQSLVQEQQHSNSVPSSFVDNQYANDQQFLPQIQPALRIPAYSSDNAHGLRQWIQQFWNKKDYSSQEQYAPHYYGVPGRPIGNQDKYDGYRINQGLQLPMQPVTPNRNPYFPWLPDSLINPKQIYPGQNLYNPHVAASPQQIPYMNIQPQQWNNYRPPGNQYIGAPFYPPQPPIPYGSVNGQITVGDPSNYQEISEEEITKRAMEYSQEQRKQNKVSETSDSLHLGGERRFSQLPRQNQRPHDNGLLLSGNPAHDHMIKNFNNLISGWSAAGVEALFEEIDMDRDGVIKLEEFRNFIWLHEIHVPN
ncbi:unnamed protein product [Calicophoron daubneyi]|uniref:EF-hand domain-containing protein n=1 Tax=Calicophoron daubneyi TaxID=300641 RepID=A0AAV2T5P4_CALDB